MNLWRLVGKAVTVTYVSVNLLLFDRCFTAWVWLCGIHNNCCTFLLHCSSFILNHLWGVTERCSKLATSLYSPSPATARSTSLRCSSSMKEGDLASCVSLVVWECCLWIQLYSWRVWLWWWTKASLFPHLPDHVVSHHISFILNKPGVKCWNGFLRCIHMDLIQMINHNI